MATMLDLRAPTLRLETPIRLLHFVDDLDERATGEVVFAGSNGMAGGVVFVQDRRVCWAAARGLARRLMDLLRERGSLKLDNGRLEQLVLRCREQGVPLGEALVDGGILRAEELRDALRKHTAASLGALLRPGARATWNPRARGGYNPRFTFDTSELFVAFCAEVHPEHAAIAEARLESLLEEREWGACFLRPTRNGDPAVVATRGPCPRLEELVDLAAWTTGFVETSAALGGDLRLTAIRSSGKETLAVWREDDRTYVVSANDTLVGRLMKRNRGTDVRS